MEQRSSEISSTQQLFWSVSKNHSGLQKFKGSRSVRKTHTGQEHSLRTIIPAQKITAALHKSRFKNIFSANISYPL